MASISKDAKGLRRILFVGADGKRAAVYLGKLPKKAAEAISTKIEAIVATQVAKISIDRETADWIGGLDARLYGKLAAVGLVPKRSEPASNCTTVAAFVESYLCSLSVKKGTATAYGHTRRNLADFFKGKNLVDVTQGDADDFRRYLGRPKKEQGAGLSANTVNRRCGVAKQFFRAANRKRLIPDNPFGDMKGLSARGNKAKEFLVTRKMAALVLDACPDAQWRLLFALSRFGGLRCPSEHLGLTWRDIDWDRGRMTIHSPKTEHHEGGESRQIPIFPELRPYLEQVWDEAAEGTESVITRYRDTNGNLRTQLHRIIRKAGLEPWVKPFHNLRSTRETELAETFPIHVVCAWIGNTEAVARKHYLQVTDEHFERGQKPTQNPTHKGAKLGKMEPNGDTADSRIPRENRDFSGISKLDNGRTKIRTSDLVLIRDAL